MRLFVGIELDERTRERCLDAQARLRGAAFEAAYEAPEKLHLTLAFLGSVLDERSSDVERVMSEVCSRTRAFELLLDRVGAFPNERRPRIVYVGSRAQSPAFRSLSNALRTAYAPLGFTFAEDPVAHVTIARIKGGSRRPLPAVQCEPDTMPVREIALFESINDERTTRYVVRSVSSLQPG